MELSVFIETTLKEIAEGVRKGRAHGKGGIGVTDNIAEARRMSQVDFDVAVTSSKSTEGNVGIGIQVLGAGGSHKSEHEQVSRIKFSVPINYYNLGG